MAIIRYEMELTSTSALRDECTVSDNGKEVSNTKSHFLNGIILIAQ